MTGPSGKAYQPRKNIGWWTDQRIEQLKLLWGDGLSATQIVDAMGCGTRNGVLGKVHRLRLPGRVRQERAAIKPTKPRTGRLIRNSGVIALAEKARETSLRVIDRQAIADAAIAVQGGIPFLDIAREQCRWPLTESRPLARFRFCGKRATDGSYCGEHRARSINRSGFRAEAAE